MSKEKEEVPVRYEDVGLPANIVNVLTSHNQFLTGFLNMYNFKQRSELRVTRLNTILSVKKQPGVSTHLCSFKLVIELQQSGEMMILQEKNWSVNDITDVAFASEIGRKIHSAFYLMMRHGLATVIRTAQKKGAGLII